MKKHLLVTFFLLSIVSFTISHKFQEPVLKVGLMVTPTDGIQVTFLSFITNVTQSSEVPFWIFRS